MIVTIDQIWYLDLKSFLMRIFIIPLLLLFWHQVDAQDKNERAIKSLLERQSTAWNDGNLEGFMEGYWKNDSLMFIGSTGVTYGWTNTLNNYKKGYPDTSKMGKLTFTLLHIKKLSGRYYHVTGKWFLKRTVGDLGGHFTLLFKRVRGEWVVISDHSS